MHLFQHRIAPSLRTSRDAGVELVAVRLTHTAALDEQRVVHPRNQPELMRVRLHQHPPRREAERVLPFREPLVNRPQRRPRHARELLGVRAQQVSALIEPPDLMPPDVVPRERDVRIAFRQHRDRVERAARQERDDVEHLN